MCPNVPVLHFLCNLVTLNGNFDWSLIPKYIFFKLILQGVSMTVVLAVLAQVFGSLIGLLLYFIRRAQVAPLRWLGNAYIWFFRGTPLLLQIILFYYLIPIVGLYGPINSINFFPALGFDRVPIDSFFAALVALSLNEGAYMAEIVRAGIEAVDKGQMEAAQSLGMTYGLAMRRVVLPQALRVIIPPTGNEFISMLKTSSLASIVSLDELLFRTQNVYESTTGVGAAHGMELLTVASIYYLVMTTVFSIGQAWLESRLGDRRSQARRSWWTGVLSLGGAVRR